MRMLGNHLQPRIDSVAFDKASSLDSFHLSGPKRAYLLATNGARKMEAVWAVRLGKISTVGARHFWELMKIHKYGVCVQRACGSAVVSGSL